MSVFYLTFEFDNRLVKVEKRERRSGTHPTAQAMKIPRLWLISCLLRVPEWMSYSGQNELPSHAIIQQACEHESIQIGNRNVHIIQLILVHSVFFFSNIEAGLNYNEFILTSLTIVYWTNRLVHLYGASWVSTAIERTWMTWPPHIPFNSGP